MIFVSPIQMVSTIQAAGVEIREALNEQAAEPLVYLLDRAGANFGYFYEWDAFGPHSHELATDIANLTAEDLTTQEELEGPVKCAAEKIHGMLEPPDTIRLDQPTWLRLLAAVHYLQKVAGLDLANGDRPPYVRRNFEDKAIEAAKETVADLA